MLPPAPAGSGSDDIVLPGAYAPGFILPPSPTAECSPPTLLNELSSRIGRGPGPLEVVAAEVAGHVHDFAYEVEAGRAPRLQRLGRKFIRRDAAARHLGLLESFGAGGL